MRCFSSVVCREIDGAHENRARNVARHAGTNFDRHMADFCLAVLQRGLHRRSSRRRVRLRTRRELSGGSVLQRWPVLAGKAEVNQRAHERRRQQSDEATRAIEHG